MTLRHCPSPFPSSSPLYPHDFRLFNPRQQVDTPFPPPAISPITNPEIPPPPSSTGLKSAFHCGSYTIRERKHFKHFYPKPKRKTDRRTGVIVKIKAWNKFVSIVTENICLIEYLYKTKTSAPINNSTIFQLHTDEQKNWSKEVVSRLWIDEYLSLKLRLNSDR